MAVLVDASGRQSSIRNPALYGWMVAQMNIGITSARNNSAVSAARVQAMENGLLTLIADHDAVPRDDGVR